MLLAVLGDRPCVDQLVQATLAQLPAVCAERVLEVFSAAPALGDLADIVIAAVRAGLVRFASVPAIAVVLDQIALVADPAAVTTFDFPRLTH